MEYLIFGTFLGLPILSVILFIVSLICFLAAPKNSETRKTRKKIMVALAIVAGVLVAIVVSIVCLFVMALANM